MRWREQRKLWNEDDPIGVVKDAEIDDEYEAYVGPHLGLLEGGADDEAIFEHIKREIIGYIGLTWSPHLEEETRVRINRCQAWFEKSSDAKLH